MILKDILDKLNNTMSSLPVPIQAVMKIAGIVVVSFIIIKLGSIIITKLLHKQSLFKYGIHSKKINTILSLSISVFKYTIYLIAGIIILSDVLGLKSILAAAGVGGIAVGLGAQSLIKDVISGFFIVLEDQYSVDDLVTIGEMTGTVEDLGLRVTRLRNFNGDLYIIPNGEISRVTNHTRGNKAVIVDIPVSYNADMEKTVEAANKVCKAVNEEFYEVITDLAKVIGITTLDRGGMTLRVMAKTLANEQWGVERRIRVLVKEEFDRADIKFF
ncbi:small conductance mechanosensitive channel [Anaerobacterium chartisolvens]|uniref:Small conductance mechanosensitive channel n=1 Tax=Anaerobacterium chartisolvens TaxID=1297424 RepID=A0A369AYD6_9FIRM|nr:mechanosensitive ion channel family protein [Anaerobacterium chartisolvens]RCX13196.1 small conductance mechanosensitive channel [Anaerobacterium chartisolvens]